MSKLEVVPKAAFDSLVGTVALLTGEVEELKARVAQLEVELAALQAAPSAGEDFGYEIVSSVAPSEAAPVGPSAALLAGLSLPVHRVQIAEQIGFWARRCLNGQPRGLSGRERIAESSRFYIVFQDKESNLLSPPEVFDSWAKAKPRVISGQRPAAEAIFVGVPSKAEVKVVITAAGLPLPAAFQTQ